jgi:hypothetical protein
MYDDRWGGVEEAGLKQAYDLITSGWAAMPDWRWALNGQPGCGAKEHAKYSPVACLHLLVSCRVKPGICLSPLGKLSIGQLLLNKRCKCHQI